MSAHDEQEAAARTYARRSEHEARRRKLAEDTEKFLRRGGAVEVVPSGVSRQGAGKFHYGKGCDDE